MKLIERIEDNVERHKIKREIEAHVKQFNRPNLLLTYPEFEDIIIRIFYDAGVQIPHARKIKMYFTRGILNVQSSNPIDEYVEIIFEMLKQAAYEQKKAHVQARKVRTPPPSIRT